MPAFSSGGGRFSGGFLHRFLRTSQRYPPPSAPHLSIPSNTKPPYSNQMDTNMLSPPYPESKPQAHVQSIRVYGSLRLHTAGTSTVPDARSLCTSPHDELKGPAVCVHTHSFTWVDMGYLQRSLLDAWACTCSHSLLREPIVQRPSQPAHAAV